MTTHRSAPTAPEKSICAVGGYPAVKEGDEIVLGPRYECETCRSVIDLWEAMASDRMNPKRAERAMRLLGLR